VVVGVLVGLVVVYLVAGPLLMLLFSSFRATGHTLPFEATTFTFDNYVIVFTSGLTYRLLGNTLWYASGSLVLGLSLGATLGWLIERTNMPGRGLLLTLLMMSIAVPALVDTMAWIVLANPNNGLINLSLRNAFGFTGDGPFDIYSIPGMILVTGCSMVPSIYIMVSGLFARMDPALEEAAQMSGAGFLATARKVTLPLLRPGLLGAAIYFFVVGFETFEVPALLGMTQGIFVFTTMIYQATHPITGLPDFGLASGYAMVQLGLSAVLIYLYSRSTRDTARFSVIGGKAYRPRRVDLGRWRYVALVLVALYFCLTTLVPFLVLVWTSLHAFLSVPSLDGLKTLSLANFQRIPRMPGFADAVRTTVVVSGCTVVITLVLAGVSSWMSVRSVFKGSSVPERLSFLVVATPSIVMGLALTFIYLWVPLPIYGTGVILVIAFSTRFLPFSTRLLTAALLQIHRELEEAAQTSGASWRETTMRITVPLILPSLWRTAMWVIAHSVRETTLAIMLFSVSNATLGVMLWLAWVQYTDTGLGAALAVCLALISGVFTYFLGRRTILSGSS
jgi:iron(III) transport system permease protein